MRRLATYCAMLLAIANEIPCAGTMTAVLTPTTSPRELASGPPEFPGLSAASVCTRSSINRPVRARIERPTALTTPVVTVAANP